MEWSRPNGAATVRHMPLPAPLSSLVTRPDFWDVFFWSGEGREPEVPELDQVTVSLPAGGSVLEVRLTVHPALQSLHVRGPDAPGGALLGYLDLSHTHPHTLRWDEVEAIGRAVAICDPELPHPGIPVLLLLPYAPICQDDDLDLIVGTVEAAFRSVGVSPDAPVVQRALEGIDHREDGFVWSEEPALGWVLDQQHESPADDLCTLRTADDVAAMGYPGHVDVFPFAAWGRFMDEALAVGRDAASRSQIVRPLAERCAADPTLAAAAEVAAALEAAAGAASAGLIAALRAPELASRAWALEVVTDAPPGQLVRLALGPTTRVFEPLRIFSLEVPEDEESTHGFAVEDALRAALAPLRGAARCCGTTSTEGPDGAYVRTASSVEVTFRGDLERGLDVIRPVLRSLELPPGATLQQIAPVQEDVAL